MAARKRPAKMAAPKTSGDPNVRGTLGIPTGVQVEAAPKIRREQVEGVQKIQELENKAYGLGVEHGHGELFTVLRKIEARLEFLNERDNLNSFALAVPTGVQGARAGRTTTEPAPPQPPSVFQRIDQGEKIDAQFDERISQLYSRVCDIERALFGEARG
jgi:hypothetical protein